MNALASSPTSPTPTHLNTGTGRLVSLDALRGFDMFWILGADALVQALGKMNDSKPVQFLAEQLDHKPWSGFAFYDLIFPMFVFIVGVSLVFSLSKMIQQHGRSEAVKRVLIRGAILFLLGIFYNGGLSNRWPDIRILGVLQRIALAYTGAGLLFCFTKPRVMIATFIAILIGYWAMLTFIPIRDFQLDRKKVRERFSANAEPAAPNEEGRPQQKKQNQNPSKEKVREAFDATTTYVTGKYEPGLNLTNHLDFQYLPGAKYDTYWDPEGYLSTLPGIASCLLGVFAGLYLRREDRTDAQRLIYLFAGGAIAVTLGFLWGLQFPVVKKIWTSSFVLVAGGYSMLLLGAFYYLVDVRQWRKWCTPFIWIGMNPITLYLSTAVVNFEGIAKHFVGGDVNHFAETHIGKGAGELLAAFGTLAVIIVLARFLYQRKIFLRV